MSILWWMRFFETCLSICFMFFTRLLPSVLTDRDGGDGSDLLHIIFPLNGCQLYNFSMLSFHLKNRNTWHCKTVSLKRKHRCSEWIWIYEAILCFLLLDGSSHHLFSTPLTSGLNRCSLWHQHIFIICQMWLWWLSLCLWLGLIVVCVSRLLIF